MSYSSLWVMNKNYEGSEAIEFSNSWCFTPVVLDILFEKYIPSAHLGKKKSFITESMFDETLFGRLNEKINTSFFVEDRILWELCNQQIFYTKDKDIVVKSIKEFLIINKHYCVDLGEHVYERFDEISLEISKLKESETPYFIFKNTSVDDGVEYWFNEYDEDGNLILKSLKGLGNLVAEFVVIEDNKITRFINNLDYFKL